MKKENENFPASVKELELAWQEFFKNKPKPKTDDQEKKQMEEFMKWYNYERKQSDTGKTPAEMFREIYGEESRENSRNPSRLMNFEWDESYKEPDEMLIEADELISKGKYHEALTSVDEALDILGENEEAFLMRAEILNYLGKFEEAEEYLKEVGKGNLKAYSSFYRAQRYLFEGNFVRALKYMKEAYEQEPENFDFVIGLANHLYFENDLYYKDYIEKAKKIDKKRTENFLKEFWLEPKEMVIGPFSVVTLNCADKLMKENNAGEAEKNLGFLIIWERYLEKEFIKVIRGLQIECFIMQKKFDIALDKIDELVQIDKNNPHAYFYKAQIFYQSSKLNEALELVDKCLEISDKVMIPHPDFYMLKAMILRKQDDDESIYYETKAKELTKGQEILKEAIKEFAKDAITKSPKEVEKAINKLKKDAFKLGKNGKK